MSQTAYTGLPGSGKSYTVVQDVIIPAIKAGRIVYTNIPLNDELFIAEFGACPVHFETKDLLDNPNWFLSELPSGAVLVLDEAWRLWPSGLKTNNVNPAHKEFLAEHRHRVGEDGKSTEIVLVTQDCAQLSAFVRQLIEKTYRCKKLDTVGQDLRYRIDIYEGAVTGANPPLDKRVREIYGAYKPEIYRFYKSHTKSETGAAGDEQKIDQRANIFKGGKMKMLFAAMVILPLLTGFLIWRMVQSHNQKIEQAKIEQQKQVASKLSAAKPAEKKPKQIGFLHDKEIFISGVQPSGMALRYFFHVRAGDREIRLETNDLMRLGYAVVGINPCLANVVGLDDNLYVMCPSPQKTKAASYSVMQNVMASPLAGADNTAL